MRCMAVRFAAPYIRTAPMRTLVTCLALAAAGPPLVAQCPDGTPPPCPAAARGARPAGPGGNSVAVLVFENRARDSSLSLLAEGLADQITTNLSGVSRLEVRSSASVRTVLGQGSREPRRLGQALNARYLVDGAMLPGAGRVRVSVQLIEAGAGRVRWSTTFQQPTNDLFALISAVSDSVARAIAGELAPAERAALTARPTRSAAAYDAYVRGRAFLRRYTSPSLRRAVIAFEDAVAGDSGFARAYAGLAEALMWLDSYMPARVVYPPARAAADRAVALDSTLADALAARAAVAAWFDWEYPLAERLARAAIAREPQHGRARLALAYALLSQGRFDEAGREAALVAAADSLDEPAVSDGVALLYLAGRTEEALRLLRAMQRNFPGANLDWGYEYMWHSGACGRLGAPAQLAFWQTLCDRGLAAARQVADSVAAAVNATGGFVTSSRLSRWYGAVGDTAAALHWAERMVNERSVIAARMGAEPSYRSLHADPRFIALARRAGVVIRQP
jgi:serine/threonine-protein kinase